MKNRVIAMLLCLLCMTALAACGKAPQVSEASATETAQTFGNAPVESPEMAQTVPEEDSTGWRVSAKAEDSAVNQSVMAAILCAQDGLTYDPEDPVYFWRAVGYLITLRSMDETFTSSGTDGTHLTAENLPIFTQAMFADYSGEVPSVTEEDPLVSRTEDGGYLIHGPEVSLEMALGEITPTQDGGYTAQAELKNQGENQGVYQVSLVDYTGPEAGKALFRYSLTGVTKLS